MELEKNIRTNYSENIVIGQIFMAIDNLAFKCQDIDNVIKAFKNSKKGEQNDMSRENSLNDNKNKVKGSTQKDMFEPVVTQENLEYILNTMNDLKEILKRKYWLTNWWEKKSRKRIKKGKKKIKIRNKELDV